MNDQISGGVVASFLLLGLLWFIFRTIRKMRPGRVAFIEAQFEQFKVEGEIISMELREGQSTVLTGRPKTSAGHPAAYQTGSASWTSSDESVVSVEQDPADELKARIRGVDGTNNESVVVECRIDGDPDEGEERILIGTLDVTCTQGEAKVFDLEAGPIEDGEGPAEQPEPTEPEAPTNVEDEAGSEGSDTGTPDDEPAGSAGGDDQVKPGDPGTATGPPIETPNPNDNADAGDPEKDPDANEQGGSGSEPIAGENSPNPANPVEGTEADSTVPGGSHSPDESSPSNLPGTQGNAF